MTLATSIDSKAKTKALNTFAATANKNKNKKNKNKKNKENLNTRIW